MAQEFVFTRDVSLPFYVCEERQITYCTDFKKGQTVYAEVIGKGNTIDKVHFSMCGGLQDYQVEFNNVESDIMKRLAAGENISFDQWPLLVWKSVFNKFSGLKSLPASVNADKIPGQVNDDNFYKGLPLLSRKGIFFISSLILITGLFFLMVNKYKKDNVQL